MKLFEAREIREARAHAANGGQALHVHRFIGPGAPRCFRAAVARGEHLGHLFDQDVARLTDTARDLGVRRIVVEKKGTPSQHVDLCGAPLRRAMRLIYLDDTGKLFEGGKGR